MTTPNQQIASTILRYLGNNRFAAMTGAELFVAIESGLQFRLPSNFAKDGINCVQIRLNGLDLFDMVFIKIRGINVREVSKVEGIYFDQLRECFTEATGLDVHL